MAVLTTPPVEILVKMRDIMHASGEFSGLTGYTIGMFPYIPIADRYAICQLAILDGLPEKRETQHTDMFYTGQAVFEVLDQDIFALAGTPATTYANTYCATVDLCTKFLKVFRDEDNHSLNNLTLTNGGRVEYIDLNQSVEYLASIERDNNHLNRGIVSFQVRTKEPAT